MKGVEEKLLLNNGEASVVDGLQHHQQTTSNPCSPRNNQHRQNESLFIRLRSSQQTTEAAYAFCSPVLAVQKGTAVGTASSGSGQLRFKNSNASGQAEINNQYFTQQIGSHQLLQQTQVQSNQVGSDSYRKFLRESCESEPPITFAGLVEMEQKTLTSVKKTAKIGISQSVAVSQMRQSVTHTDLKNIQKVASAPSEAFMSQVIQKVNNTLKPPNWTKRKQNLMWRLNSQASPPMASNISYHLDELANLYKESGKKVREGTGPSLMEQLLMANENNAKFLTPNSKSQIAPSLLSSTKKKFGRVSSNNSTDKFSQFKNSINRQSQQLSESLRKARLFQKQKINMPLYKSKVSQRTGEQMSMQTKLAAASNESAGGAASSQRSNLSPTAFQLKTKPAEGTTNGLPPRPIKQVQSPKANLTLQSGIGSSRTPQIVIEHQRSTPEKDLTHQLMLIEENSVLTSNLGSGGGKMEENKSGSAYAARQGVIVSGSSFLSCSESEKQTDHQVAMGGQ